MEKGLETQQKDDPVPLTLKIPPQMARAAATYFGAAFWQAQFSSMAMPPLWDWYNTYESGGGQTPEKP